MKYVYKLFLGLAFVGTCFLSLNAEQSRNNDNNNSHGHEVSHEHEMKFFFPNLNVKQIVKYNIKSNKTVSGQEIIKAFNKLRKSLDLEPKEHYFISLNGGKVLPTNSYTTFDLSRNIIVMEDDVPVKFKNLPERIQREVSLIKKKLKKVKAMADKEADEYSSMIENPDLAIHGEKTIKTLAQMYGMISANVNGCLNSLERIKD